MRRIKFFISAKLNKLNVLASSNIPKIANEPPITAEKKGLNACRQMLETKWPRMLEGVIAREYLKEVEIKFILMFGIAFFIFLKFSNEIIVIEIKNDTDMLLILIIGVKTINEMNNAIDPMM